MPRVAKSTETHKCIAKVCLTKAQQEKVKASANLLHMSVSEYIRMKVFGSEWNQKANTNER